jgi:hypothetical protein
MRPRPVTHDELLKRRPITPHDPEAIDGIKRTMGLQMKFTSYASVAASLKRPSPTISARAGRTSPASRPSTTCGSRRSTAMCGRSAGT